MRVISLLYHDVVPAGALESSGFSGADSAIYKLETPEFERHLQALRHVIERAATVRDLAQHGRKAVLLTFDDGGSSAHEYIVDLIESLDWRGHFFITTNWIGRRTFLAPTQIRDLRARGHFIGSHSCSHPPRMSHCSGRELRDEWTRSVAVLSDILGEAVDIASVPGGYYSRNVAEAAAESGIRTLFTSEPLISPHIVNRCVVLGRFTVKRGITAETVAAIAAGQTIPRVQQYAYWNLKKFAKAAGGTYWLQMRKWILSKRCVGDHP